MKKRPCWVFWYMFGQRIDLATQNHPNYNLTPTLTNKKTWDWGHSCFPPVRFLMGCISYEKLRENPNDFHPLVGQGKCLSRLWNLAYHSAYRSANTAEMCYRKGGIRMITGLRGGGKGVSWTPPVLYTSISKIL